METITEKPSPKPCPKCGKLMLLVETGFSAMCNPPLVEYRWLCGCGHREEGPQIRQRTEHEINMDRWKKLNEVE